jgi:geranylgeranyl diphosphate synthase, type II
MLTYREIFDLIEEKIKQIEFNSEPVQLYDPIQYVLSLGGKRLRPCLAVMSNNLFTDVIDDIIYPAIAIEIFHNFTLLHDDIMDKAPLRRNNSTVHVKWNENVAILSGDAMLIMAYDLVAKTSKDLKSKVLNTFTKTALEVCEGQQYDMNFENRHDVTLDQYIKMISLKTASLLAASLAIGAMTADAADREIELLYNFGMNIGIAFQLQDDYLDVYADCAKFGKSVGGDILSNKNTYLLISALQSGNKKQLDELLFWLSKEEYNPKEKIFAVTKIYNQLDIGNRTTQLAETYFKKGNEFLQQVKVDQNRKTLLKDLVLRTMKRES